MNAHNSVTCNSQNWKQPKSPSTDNNEWINKMICPTQWNVIQP